MAQQTEKVPKLKIDRGEPFTVILKDGHIFMHVYGVVKQLYDPAIGCYKYIIETNDGKYVCMIWEDLL